MSKNIKQNILDQITSGKISMRPRMYFITGSILSVLGLLLSAMTLIVATYLIRFDLTHPGPGADRKLSILIANLPLVVPVIAVFSLIGGLYLLRRYDFSYRRHFGYILLVVIASLWLGVVALERSPIEEFLNKRGYQMQRSRISPQSFDQPSNQHLRQNGRVFNQGQ